MKGFLLFILLFCVNSQMKAQTAFQLNSSGTSHLLWPFGSNCSWANRYETYNGTNAQWAVVSGSGSHTGADTYADDWNWGSGNTDEGQELYACGSGTIIFVNNTAGTASTCGNSFGRQIIIRFTGSNFAVRYAHLQSVATGLSAGTTVTAGQYIGRLGKTGLTGILPCTAHLHIVMYKNISNGSTALINLQSGLMPPSSCAAPFYLDATTSTSTSCPTPTNSQLSATATSNSITVTSNYNTSGTTARQFGYRQYGTSTWNNLSSTSSTSQTISGLLPSTTYEINQRAYCNGVWTAWSSSIMKTTLSSGGTTTCGTPTGVTTSSPTSSTCSLSWNAVAGSSYYTLWYLSGSSWVNFGSNVYGTSTGVTGLAASTQYCFAVKAVCGTTTSSQSASACVTTLSSGGGTGGGTTTGGCTGGVQYPANTLYPNSSWQIANCLYAGEYALVAVTSGTTYTFSLCATSGGSASYDSELTLLNGSTLAQVHYADDICGDDAHLTWTANFTGNLRVLVSAYHCASNSICSNLAFKIGTGKTEDSFTQEPSNMAMEVFPNPASNEVSISFNGQFDNSTPSKLLIYNAAGQIVIEKEINENIRNPIAIDVNHLENGIYMAQLLNGNATPAIAKLVVSR